MRKLRKLILILLLSAVAVGPAAADIYMWTDSSGTRHITNYAPPPHAELIMRTPEIPYDAEADRRRQESDRQQQLAREKLALAERETQLLEREREANARVAEAGQLARETLAIQREMASETRDDDRYLSYGWYAPYRQPYYRSYYRKNGSIYYLKPEHRPHRGKTGDHRVTHDRGPVRGKGYGPGSYENRADSRRVPRSSGRDPYNPNYIQY